MKKLLSILMVCVFSVLFAGVQIGCDANNGKGDDGAKVENQTDVGAEEQEIIETDE